MKTRNYILSGRWMESLRVYINPVQLTLCVQKSDLVLYIIKGYFTNDIYDHLFSFHRTIKIFLPRKT